MTSQTSRSSGYYAVAQSALLCGFAGVFILDTGPDLLVRGTTATIGTALCAAGLALMLLAFVSIGGTIQIAPVPRPGRQLVTNGVYGVFRHPIYTAIVFLAAGLFLRKPTLLVALAGAVVVVFLVFKVRIEEQLLRAAYAEYAAYRRRTWGLIPWFRSRR